MSRRLRCLVPPVAAHLLAASALAVAPAGQNPAAPAAARFDGKLVACQVPGVEGEVFCGDHEVFEDRVANTGRKIRLKIVLLPALENALPDPVVFLAGGGVRPATRMAPFLSRALSQLRRSRDILLVDQRGTGESNPLQCELPDPFADPASRSEAAELAAYAACRASLSRNADLRWYTTPVAMQDLREICDALGYAQVNLWGASYGTKAARVYLRQNPGHVRSVVLHGTVPLAPPMWLDLSRSADAVLAQLVDACAADPACRAAFPQAGQEFVQLLETVTRTPATVLVPDPGTGSARPVTVDGSLVLDVVYDALYSWHSMCELPAVLHAASAGNWQPFARWIRFGRGDIPSGVFRCILCTEDVARIRDADIGPATAGTLWGDAALRRHQAICRDWPRGWLPDDFFTPVRSAVPVLLLTGALDHATPPAYAEREARFLSHSRTVILPARGHNDVDPCIVGMIQDFIRTADPDSIDTRCLPKTLQFVTDPTALTKPTAR